MELAPKGANDLGLKHQLVQQRTLFVFVYSQMLNMPGICKSIISETRVMRVQQLHLRGKFIQSNAEHSRGRIVELVHPFERGFRARCP